MAKMSRQKIRYLKIEKSFYVRIKSIFIIFKGLSLAKKYLRSKGAPLNQEN